VETNSLFVAVLLFNVYVYALMLFLEFSEENMLSNDCTS